MHSSAYICGAILWAMYICGRTDAAEDMGAPKHKFANPWSTNGVDCRLMLILGFGELA